MADLRIADAPEIDESEVQGGLKIPTGGFGNKAINMTTVASWVVKDKDLPSKGYVDDKFNQGNQGLSGHVNNKNNPHEVTKEQVGLGNVDNTADADKPISNATSAALNLKADKTQLDVIETDLEDSKALFQYDGKYKFDAAYTEKIGGYPLNARLMLSDGSIVQNTVAGNKTDPNVNMTGWEKGTRASDVQVGNSTLDVFAQQIKNQELNYNKTVTVGTGGNFVTINAALESLSKDKPIYVFNDDSEYRAEIKLLSGFVVNEQININGIDFGFVTITSEDAEVIVNQLALTKKIGRWYSFIRCKNGVSPIISTLFNMNRDGTSTSDYTGLYLINSRCFINIGAGIKNSSGRNVDITQGSIFIGSSGIFTGAGTVAIRPATGSVAFLQYADLSNSTNGLSAGSGATVAAEEAIINDCSVTAVEVQGACSVVLSNAQLKRSGQYALYAKNRCVIDASGANLSDGGGVGVLADRGANIDLDSAVVNNCGGSYGVRATNGAIITGAKLTATNNNINLQTTKGGQIITDLATLTNAITIGLSASEAGRIIATNSQYRKTDGVDSNSDAQVLSGGQINVINSVGGVSQKTDVQLPTGIIYKGLKTKAKGAASIDAGLTSITVTHTLQEIPILSVTPVTNLGVASKWWVSAANETTFTINIDTTTTGRLVFHWLAELI